MASPARALSLVLLVCAPVAGCSIDFDGFLRPVVDTDAGTDLDTGVEPPADTGITPPADTGIAPPMDTGIVPPRDVAVPPVDTGIPPVRDTGVTPVDTGNPQPMGCPTPYVAVAAEELTQGAGKLVRWSFGTGQRCPDLPLTVQRPHAVGLAFDNLSDVSGPRYVIASQEHVALAAVTTGTVENLVPSGGLPRSIFEIVSNGAGTFGVAYTNLGSAPTPGEVGEVRIYNHRTGLNVVQTWARNMLVPYAIPGSSIWITAFPGNQGQSTRIGNPMSGDGYSYFVQTPSSTGMQTQMATSLTNRPGLVSAYAYRTRDRRGHYAVTASSGSGRWVHIAHAGVSATSPSFNNLIMASCGTPTCTSITRAAAFPDDSAQAVVICQSTGGATHLVRFGGASTGCQLVGHTDIGPGNWRLNDLAVVPRED